MSTISISLNRLLDSDGSLMASAFTPKQRVELEHFARNTRLITICKQGRSVIFQISNRDRVVDFLRAQKPLHDEQLDPSLPARSRNIGKERDSKKGQTSHESYYLLMKAWDDSVVWQDENHVMNPAEQTERFGVTALKIASGDRWQTNGPLWLVENQALFDRWDWLPHDFYGCVAYYAGQLPKVFIQWLAEQKRSPEIILFPDYDGIGLANYVRLLKSRHPESSLQFYWMPDWENKLQKFGNAAVWQKTRSQFEKAIEQLQARKGLNDDFVKLAHLSQFYGKALEQEAIWL